MFPPHLVGCDSPARRYRDDRHRCSGEVEGHAGADCYAEQRAVEQLVRGAREHGPSLTGPEGLLTQMTKAVLETVLNQEMTEHVGHDKPSPAGNEAGNAERDQIEDGADREHRRGRHQGAAGPGLHVRPTDRPQAAAEADRGR